MEAFIFLSPTAEARIGVCVKHKILTCLTETVCTLAKKCTNYRLDKTLRTYKRFAE
jgi:hypothetical protein